MEMIKEAFICGLGMIVDISGSHYSHAQPPTNSAAESISSDWNRVGNMLKLSIAVERPKVEAESARQLQLKLG